MYIFRSSFLLLIFTMISMSVQSQVYGEANVFGYDNMGNRVSRQYLANTIIHLKPTKSKIDSIDGSVANKNEVKVIAYPNPVGNLLTIENLSWNAENQVKVDLLDITGKLISSQQISKPTVTIEFNGMPSGSYIVNYYLNRRLNSTWKIIRYQ